MSDVFLLPDPGEGLTEADIVAWKVAEGDSVTVNQILVEVETAKSLVELPSPQAGLIAELLVAEGDTVEVGSPIVRFGNDVDPGGAEPDDAAEGAGAAPGGDAQAPPTSAGANDSAADDDASGATLVGYGAIGGSAKRRPRKQGSAPVGGAAGTAAADASGDTAPGVPAGVSAPAHAATPADAGTGAAQPAAAASGSRPLAKPPVRKLAKDLGVDLATVPATGARGEVTRADLSAFAESGGASARPEAEQADSRASIGAVDAGGRQAAQGDPAADSAAAQGPGAHAGQVPREESVPLKGVRKAMAKAMVDSAFTAPHVTEGVEVDVTGMMDLVRRLKETRRLEARVSPLLVVAKAVTWAARRYPYMNARLDGDTITVRNYVNLGIAAATPRGLIVPNVKDAHTLGLGQLAQELGDLVETARAGRTTPAAQAGGTITVTNVGVFGVDWGTPIINPGESAIVAVGRVVKKPWVVDDQVVPREVMTVTVSADHRVVDGETISMFLRDLADALEEPTNLLV